VIDEAAAKRIILTPEGGSRTIERWTIETPYLVRLIMDHVILDRNSLVLDYGCGIGRIAKELIRQTGCHVIGVDICPSMLSLTYPYVHSDNFSAISQTTFKGLSWDFDLAICVWVLQHCLEPDKDIAYIYDALKDNGDLFVVNNIELPFEYLLELAENPRVTLYSLQVGEASEDIVSSTTVSDGEIRDCSCFLCQGN
jgi:2-polyprenyl-3-methyl-5-hydroxy-6-metoxy-1,4-benzoquinol methylase